LAGVAVAQSPPAKPAVASSTSADPKSGPAGAPAPQADPARDGEIKEKLKAFAAYVGSWKGTATPQDRESKRKRAFWKETGGWGWSLAKGRVGLVWKPEGSRRFKEGFLTWDPGARLYRLRLTTGDDRVLDLSGPESAGGKIELTGDDGKGKIRIQFGQPNENRLTAVVFEQGEGQPGFLRTLEIGYTREGVQYAGPSGPVCIVTGGLGTIPVKYQGKTYYVCCSGCKEEFEADPAKYVKKKPTS